MRRGLKNVSCVVPAHPSTRSVTNLDRRHSPAYLPKPGSLSFLGPPDF